MEALTDEQLKAITSKHPQILLIAGPGTGKTTTLTNAIIHKVKVLNTPEYRIQAFTFTNKATREMIRRIGNVLGEHNVGISTFHAYTFKYLKEYHDFNLKIVDDFIKREIIKNLILERKYDSFLKVEECVLEISHLKNEMNLKEELLYKRLRIIEIYYAYEEYLKANNKIDFDGMNLEFLNLLKNDESFRGIIIDEFDYIFVDEAQDINNIQYEILKYLTLKCNHLFMVGDP